MYYLHKHSSHCTRCGHIAAWGELYVAEAAGTGTRLRRHNGDLIADASIALVSTPLQTTAACPACYTEADAARGQAAAREWEIARKRRAMTATAPAQPGASAARPAKTEQQKREELA